MDADKENDLRREIVLDYNENEVLDLLWEFVPEEAKEKLYNLFFSD